MDDLARAADLFVLGELDGEGLSMVAAEALARGLESPALVELACLHRTDCAGAPELFRTAMAELNVVTDWRVREVDVLSEYLEFVDPTTIREQIRQGCRNLLADPPYALVNPRIDTTPPERQQARPARWRRFVESLRSTRAISAESSPPRPSVPQAIHERCCVPR